MSEAAICIDGAQLELSSAEQRDFCAAFEGVQRTTRAVVKFLDAPQRAQDAPDHAGWVLVPDGDTGWRVETDYARACAAAARAIEVVRFPARSPEDELPASEPPVKPAPGILRVTRTGLEAIRRADAARRHFSTLTAKLFGKDSRCYHPDRIWIPERQELWRVPALVLDDGGFPGAFLKEAKRRLHHAVALEEAPSVSWNLPIDTDVMSLNEVRRAVARGAQELAVGLPDHPQHCQVQRVRFYLRAPALQLGFRASANRAASASSRRPGEPARILASLPFFTCADAIPTPPPVPVLADLALPGLLHSERFPRSVTFYLNRDVYMASEAGKLHARAMKA